MEDAVEGLTNNNLAESFQNNLKDNQSLVVQINIIYSGEIEREEYPQSLQLFLKWAQIFQEHSKKGFLIPLYSSFNSYVQQLDMSDYCSVVDEVCVFVQYMVGVVTEVYGLRNLASSTYGQLIKN